MKLSLKAFLLSCLFLIITHSYYPKWDMNKTEATLSWDVSGYYMYLPAYFIYKDLKNCSFQNDIINKYQPSPQFDQAFKHQSGNYVMKYPIGQAIQYSPFFFIAHTWASLSNKYPADGFSFPYQLLIALGSLLIAFLGLWFARKILSFYFKDSVVALSILLIVFGTNYLNYSAIDGAMTHNTLFTLYAILIYYSILFNKKATYKNAIAIGLCSGLAALTRPTEAISIIIPILWSINLISIASIKNRLTYLYKEWAKLLTAILVFSSLGCIQLLYWKYATGEWIVYSYQNQGFSWLSPHFYGALISYRTGWLIYSPIMIFSLLGFYQLWKNKNHIFWGIFSFSIVFIYLVSAWDIYWYGGSIGIRAMVQSYPILLFPLAACIDSIFKLKITYKLPIYGIFALFVYFNLWLTHQAHRGGILKVGEMTKEYFWKTLGSYNSVTDDLKYLDHDEFYAGKRQQINTIYENKFDTLPNNMIHLNKTNDHSPSYFVSPSNKIDWIRVQSNFRVSQKEWNKWNMRQFIVRFYNMDEIVKMKMIRVDRMLQSNSWKQIYFDIKSPEEHFTKIGVSYYNGGSNSEVYIDNLIIQSFNK